MTLIEAFEIQAETWQPRFTSSSDIRMNHHKEEGVHKLCLKGVSNSVWVKEKYE